MLIACISERAKRLDVPADPARAARSRDPGAGAGFFRDEVRPRGKRSSGDCGIPVAIAGEVKAPGGARALNSIGRETSRAARRKIMAEAQASGLLTGRPADLAEQFTGLLWRDLMVSLLLGVAERPNPREIARRARDAAAAFLQLHPLPNDAPATRQPVDNSPSCGRESSGRRTKSEYRNSYDYPLPEARKTRYRSHRTRP